MSFLIPLSIVLIWAFMVWFKEYRLRIVAESELKIARLVGTMEDLLLEGRVVHGDLSHDVLFKAMQAVMLHRHYALNWKPWRPMPPEIRKFANKLSNEMKQCDCPFADILREFNHAYYRSFRYKHPVQWIAFPFYLLALHVGARGVVASLKASLNLLKGMNKLRGVMERRYLENAASELKAPA